MIAADPRTAADSALVKPVVAAALESAQAVGHTLEELTGFAAGEFSADGAVTRWRDRLVDPVEPLVEPSLGMARVLTSAGIAAWADGDGGAAEVDRERLAARLIELIRRAAPEGTRAAAPAGPDARELGEQLAGLLGSRSPEGPGI
jgi:hypothetical protein